MQKVKTIDEIKSVVKHLIEKNKHREITPETKYKGSGIYMIYIDNFDSDKIVPMYIGQSKDIQRRYKSHYTEILALNRLSYDEYYKYFFSKPMSLYEGRFKSAKIFKYMIENKCTLNDYRMVVLDEVDEEFLDEKKQKYFRRLLPSFFGFNQLNSFLAGIQLRYSNSASTINDYLSMLMEDIELIDTYYEYGFTRFNVEHSMPSDISYLTKDVQLGSELQLKFEEVKLSLHDLCKRFKPNFKELHKLNEVQEKLYGVYLGTRYEYEDAVNELKEEANKRFKKHRLYSEKAKDNFIYSITRDDPEYKEQFQKYLKSRHCDENFYEIFKRQIEDINKKLENKNNNKIPYEKALDLYLEKEGKERSKRYKMIFPSLQFEALTLKERSTERSIKINNEYHLFNTCHIQFYISNNGISRSYIRKVPYIIGIDYCFIDSNGTKFEKSLFIENETTINCQAGNDYFEQDFYNMYVLRKEPFKITSLIDNEKDNSFISILAEFKHGINDYTIRNERLVKLSVVLREIQQFVDYDTRYNISVSESYKCLEKCIINEGLENDSWIASLLAKKLPKHRRGTSGKIKIKKQPVMKKVTREEAYKQKVTVRSDNRVQVLNYVSSKEKVTAKCYTCGNEWRIRSDHLLAKPYCPACRKANKH